jgi:glycosyltransferase involved in cell wall biosynthesis
MKIAFLVPDDRDEFRNYSAVQPYFGPAPTALLEGFEQLDQCDIHIVSCLHRPLPATATPGKISYHPLVVPKWGWRLTCYAGCVLAIRRKLRALNPDVVHGQGTERYCGLAAALSGFHNIITIHGNMRSVARFFRAKMGSFHWVAARLESFALKRTAGVVCNSAYTEKLVQPIAHKTWRVPNALRTIFFNPPQPRAANIIPVLLNIGTIAAHKSQIEVLQVARRLFTDGYRFHLRFIGGSAPSDPYAAEFRKQLVLAEKDGFATHVVSHSTEQLIQCFDSADALIHCPREEAFGLVVAEALARNLKFFGFRRGGVTDIADGAELAELVNVDDWNGLYERIAAWMNAGFPRPTSAAATMAQRYQPSLVAQRHIEIYREVMNQTPENARSAKQ